MNRDMNFFRPFSSKRRGESTEYDKYVYLFAGLIALVMIGTLIYNSLSLYLTKSDIDDYNDKLNDPVFQAQLQESDKVNTQLNDITKYDTNITTLLTAIDSRAVVTTTKINGIKSTLPSDVSLNSLNISNESIKMVAVSKSMEPISEFEHNLGKLPFVAGVYISGISGPTDARTFDITAVLKEVK